MSKTSGLLRVIFPDAPGDWHLQYTQTFHLSLKELHLTIQVLTANIFSLYTDGLEVGIKDLKKHNEKPITYVQSEAILLIFNLTSKFLPLWFGSRPLSSCIVFISVNHVITTLQCYLDCSDVVDGMTVFS